MIFQWVQDNGYVFEPARRSAAHDKRGKHWHPIFCKKQHNPTVLMRFLQQQGVSECQALALLNGSDICWRLLNARQNFQCSGWLTHHVITVVQLFTRLVPTDHPVRLSGRPECLSLYPALSCISYLDCVWMWFIRITFEADIKIWFPFKSNCSFLYNMQISPLTSSSHNM